MSANSTDSSIANNKNQIPLSFYILSSHYIMDVGSCVGLNMFAASSTIQVLDCVWCMEKVQRLHESELFSLRKHIVSKLHETTHLKFRFILLCKKKSP